MKKKVVFLMMLLWVIINPGNISAQVQDKWEGDILILGNSLHFEIDFDKQEHGVMNVPAQGASGLRLNRKEIQNDSIFFLVDSGRSNMRFEGKITHDDSIQGRFLQSGYSGKFKLYRQKEAMTHSGVNREVKFYNDTIKLAGTLSLPDTNKKHPAVIMISGSGQQDRDENVFGFKVFKEMAPAFIDKGFAVLRYDDRGTGGSDYGNPEDCDTRDFADDARAAFQFLKQHPNINNENIGILGHSEGGMIAPMVADEHNVGFIILMAAPTVPGKDLLLRQTERILETMDFSEEEITRRKNINEEIYDEVMKENTDTSIIKQSFQKLSQSDELTIDSAAMQAQMTQQMKAVLSPWIQFFLSYNPAPQLKTLDIPVLALFGKKDVQVDSQQNKILIRDMIDQGKENYTLKIFPHANHLFQHADTGSMQEYQQLPKEFTDGFLKYITNWAEQAVR